MEIPSKDRRAGFLQVGTMLPRSIRHCGKAPVVHDRVSAPHSTLSQFTLARFRMLPPRFRLQKLRFRRNRRLRARWWSSARSRHSDQVMIKAGSVWAPTLTCDTCRPDLMRIAADGISFYDSDAVSCMTAVGSELSRIRGFGAMPGKCDSVLRFWDSCTNTVCARRNELEGTWDERASGSETQSSESARQTIARRPRKTRNRRGMISRVRHCGDG